MWFSFLLWFIFFSLLMPELAIFFLSLALCSFLIIFIAGYYQAKKSGYFDNLYGKRQTKKHKKKQAKK
jgi:hypothetical protein